MAILWLIILLLVYLFLYKYNSYPHPRFPKGYQGPPVLGFLFHFLWQRNYVKRLVQMKVKYGSICSVQMGSFLCVWLNGYEEIREAWAHPSFSGRPLVPGITERTDGFRGGVIFSDGPKFVEEQRFVVRTLRSLGLGKNAMEDIILSEALDIVKAISKTAGSPVSIRHRLNIAVLNVLWAVTTGDRYEHDNAELGRITDILDKNMELNDGAKAAIFMPWLAAWFPTLSGWRNYVTEAQEIFHFWQNIAREKIMLFEKKSRTTSDNFVDAYLQLKIDSELSVSKSARENYEKSLAATLQDLFIAGTETTATTLSWFLLYMASFPSVQNRVAAEIAEKLGTGSERRLPALVDRSILPFVEATLMETMRFGTLAPLGMLHRTTEDVSFRGYFIPANTIVMSNVAAVHMDKDLWIDPHTFRPERFLSSSKNRIENFKYFMPFGFGKRKCLGEGLARDELFIFATMILQNFIVTLDPTESAPSLEPVVGISAAPRKHSLVFLCR